MTLPEDKSDLAERGFVRVLAEEARDLERKLVPAGTSVLCHPTAPAEFLEDTASNRAKFLALDCAWTDPVRQRVWFPTTKDLPKDLSQQIDRIRSAKGTFLTTIQANLTTSVGATFPVGWNSKWTPLLPFQRELKIQQVTQVGDLTARFSAAVQSQSGARADVTWPSEWAALVQELNPVRVYEVAGPRSRAHVVVAFLTRLRLARPGEPKIAPLDQAHLDSLLDVFRQWRAESAAHRTGFAFLTVGSAEALPANLKGIAAGTYCLTLAGLTETGDWEMRRLPPGSERLAGGGFLDRLAPETRDQSIARIQACADELLFDGGNVTVARVAEASGDRPSSVRTAFFALQTQAPETYRVWRKQSQLALRQTRPGDPIKVKSASIGPRLRRRRGLQLASFAVGALIAGAGLSHHPLFGLSGFASVLLGTAVFYVGSCLQASFNRRADRDTNYTN